MDITVGLITEGAPVITEEGGLTRVSNLLIGEGFHWQRSISALFRGKIDILDSPEGSIRCINTLDIEDYIASVIGSEMNPAAPAELLKAHAVISRSWAAGKCEAVATAGRKEKCHIGFDVCSDDHCQRYQGVSSNKSTASAVEATRGLVLVDSDGELVDARYSKCCGGHTELFSTCWENVDYDYLPAQPDPWCDLADMTAEQREHLLSTCLKNYDRYTAFMQWVAQTDGESIAERLGETYGANIGNILHLEVLNRGKSGRINLLELIGERGTYRIGKTLAIRRLLAADCLKSSWFDIEEKGPGRFLLRGRGWGHGVGLCQIGGARMAIEGKDFREILGFYYPGTKIARL